MKLLLKRDQTGTGHPSPAQLEIGELVMNSVTGRLYSKLTDGSIIEWIGQRICYDPVPDISVYYNNILMANDSIDSFCCLGAILDIEVSKLKLAPEEYSFELVELTTNSNPQDITIQTPKYTEYTIPKPGTTTNETISLRKALIPINIAILNSQENISIFKFTVTSVTNDNKKLIEKIITIKCENET
jgi:hypothetical protein